MPINITSARASTGTDGNTLREQMKETSLNLTDEMFRRAVAMKQPAVVLVVSSSDGYYFTQLCAGPFKTEEEAVGLFRDLAERQTDIIRESQAIQKRKENLDADQTAGS